MQKRSIIALVHCASPAQHTQLLVGLEPPAGKGLQGAAEKGILVWRTCTRPRRWDPCQRPHFLQAEPDLILMVGGP